MKALEEYILMVMFVFLQKTVFSCIFLNLFGQRNAAVKERVERQFFISVWAINLVTRKDVGINGTLIIKLLNTFPRVKFS